MTASEATPFPAARGIFRRPGPPLYAQFAGYLRQRIESREIAPGSRLPSLHELAAAYGVARVTVRQAVQFLVMEGLLVSSQGRGTYVVDRLPRRSFENMNTSWHAMSQRVENATVVLLEQADVESCPLLAPDERNAAPVFHYMKRVHLKEGIRFAYIELYLDKRIFDLAPKRMNETTVIPIMNEMNVDIASAHQILTIDTAPVEVAGHLHIEPADPVAVIHRFARNTAGCVCYAAKVINPGSRVRFDINLVK